MKKPALRTNAGISQMNYSVVKVHWGFPRVGGCPMKFESARLGHF